MSTYLTNGGPMGYSQAGSTQDTIAVVTALFVKESVMRPDYRGFEGITAMLTPTLSHPHPTPHPSTLSSPLIISFVYLVGHRCC